LVVLVLLGAIALGSAAALRRSAGSTQLARAQLMRSIAHEQAQARQARGLLPLQRRRDGALPLALGASAEEGVSQDLQQRQQPARLHREGHAFALGRGRAGHDGAAVDTGD
jgi:hypothetical protein